MKVSGFTIVRNAIKYDYPVAESIRSILPLCDEVVVAVGDSDDGTRELIASIDPSRVRIIDTTWDETLRQKGEVLSVETNKALKSISTDADWAFYIQADEVADDRYLPRIREGMEKWLGYPGVEGLLFNYRHFWGSYDWVGASRKWYRREVRIIRPGIGVESFGDAQGFRVGGRKIRVKMLDAWINHYGWVKPPSAQQAKQQEFHKYWHDEEWMREHVGDTREFDYTILNDLARFDGTHPEVMLPRIREKNWEFTPRTGVKPLSFRHRLLDRIETKTGWRIGEYRNYKII